MQDDDQNKTNDTAEEVTTDSATDQATDSTAQEPEQPAAEKVEEQPQEEKASADTEVVADKEEPAELPKPEEEPELAPPTPAVVEESDESKSTVKEESTEEAAPEAKTEEAASQPANVAAAPADETVTAEEAPQATTEAPAEQTPASAQDAAREERASRPSGPRARWYVVHTYSGHEAKVAATLKQRVASQKLEDKVLDILVPTQDKIEIKEGKKNKIKEKIFPGYLLIKMLLDDNTWLVVRTTPGITSFVGMGNRPTPLPDEEVNTIQKYMTMEAPKFKTAFSLNEAVKITDGPFSEFLGSISKIDEEKGKLEVMVSIFGRETPVELDFLQVAKL